MQQLGKQNYVINTYNSRQRLWGSNMINKVIVMFFGYLKALTYLVGSLACFYFCYEIILMFFRDNEIIKADLKSLGDWLTYFFYLSCFSILTLIGVEACKLSLVTGYVANNHLNRKDLTDKQSDSIKHFESKLEYAETLISSLVIATVVLFFIYTGVEELIITDGLTTLCFIIGAGLFVPSGISYAGWKFLCHFDTDKSFEKVILKTIFYAGIGWVLFWPVIIETWSNGNFGDWDFLMGIIYIGFPLGMSIFLLVRYKKDGRANQIAWDLGTDAEKFMEEAVEKHPEMMNRIEDILPIENDKFKIIYSKDRFSWYSKKYDAWFLRDGGIIYHCDSAQNILYRVIRPTPISDLKKSFIRDNETRMMGRRRRQKP